MYDGIIFDLDGTLWDSRSQVVKSWNQVLERENIDMTLTVERLTREFGKLLYDIAASVFSEMPKEVREPLMDRCTDHENNLLRQEGAMLYPELEETLATLTKDYKLFIVSNCQAGYIEAFLDAHQLHKYFTDFECPGNTNLPKKDNIKLVASRNQLQNPIYVGDTASDCKSAHGAGLPFVYAAYGFGNVNADEYEYRLEEIKHLPELLRSSLLPPRA